MSCRSEIVRGDWSRDISGAGWPARCIECIKETTRSFTSVVYLNRLRMFVKEEINEKKRY